MKIVPAYQIDFCSPVRCARCDVGVLPYGRHEPFLVDDDDRVYCRACGAKASAEYSSELDAYQTRRLEERQQALKELERDSSYEGRAE